MLPYVRSRLSRAGGSASCSSNSSSSSSAWTSGAAHGGSGTQCSCSHSQWQCTTGLMRQHKGREGASSRARLVSAEHDATSVAVQFEFASPAAGRFSDDRKSFVEEHRIRGYEVGPDQKATIVTMANILQEIASNHAVALWGRANNGFARIPELMNHIFVMSRLQIRMERFPKWGDIIRVETFFAEDGRLLLRRDWHVTDAHDGTHLGSATSSWVTINTETRRLSKLAPAFRSKYLPFSPGPGCAHLPASLAKQRLPDMGTPPRFEGPVQVARRSDMDMNSHINNVTYLAWTLETVPEAIYSNHHLREVEVDFKAECQAGDTVESLGDSLQESVIGNGCHPQFLHTLRRCDESGCRELVRARTTWTNKNGYS